ELLHLVVAETEALDRSRRHVLDRDVGLLQELLDELEPPRRFEIDRQRFLVRVEHVEVPRVIGGLSRKHPAGGIARLRVLDLHHLSAEPGDSLGARRPRLELGEVYHTEPGETRDLPAVSTHPSPPHTTSVQP